MRPRLFISSIAILAAAAHGGGGALGAGQEQKTAAAMQAAREDSAAVVEEALPDSAAAGRIMPVWDAWMTASQTDVQLGSRMSATYGAAGGWFFKSSVDIARKSKRERSQEETVQSLINTAMKVEPNAYLLNITIGETYNKSVSLGLARYGKDLIHEEESAGADLVLNRKVLQASTSQISLSGGAMRGQQDFKYDKDIGGGVGGYVAWNIGGMLRIAGGAGLSRGRETSDVGPIEFASLPSRADTVRTGLSWGEGKDKLVDFSYKRTSSNEEVVTPPRGNSLEILDDPSKAIRESIERISETLSFRSTTNPLPFLIVGLGFTHTRNGQLYAQDDRLTKTTEGNDASASVQYRYHESGAVSVSVSSKEDIFDYGPGSISTFTDRTKLVSGSLRHDIRDSLTVKASGSAEFKQRFYRFREANPRDADYLSYSAQAGFSAKPWRSVQVSVDSKMDRRETINIDASLSGDNRIEYLYRIQPRITFAPRRWIQVSQDYTVRIEYTDFLYKEMENFIDRTAGLNTTASIQIGRPARFSFRHTFLLKDKGSYLENIGGDLVYSPSQEELENGIDMTVEYRLGDETAIRARGDFHDKRDNTLVPEGDRFVVAKSIIYESGGLMFGFERSRKLGDRGKLDLDVTYVRSFGPFLTEARKEYWDVNAKLTFGF